MTFVRLPVESNLLSIVREDFVSETHKGKPDSKRDKEKPSFICSLSSLEKVVFGLHFQQRFAAYNTLGYLILWSHPGAVCSALFIVEEDL